MITCEIQEIENISEEALETSVGIINNIDNVSLWEIWINPINITILISGLTLTLILWFCYGKKGRIGFMNLVPTIWTSLGILGTFFSIVNSLAINPDSFEDVKVLIEKVAPAFTSSIIGICFSIMTSLWIKYLQMHQDQIELANIGNKTPERILYELLAAENSCKIELKKLADNGDRQTSLLRTFLKEHLEEVQKFYSSLFDRSEEHAKQITERYLDTVMRIVQENNLKLDESMGELMSQHALSLKEAIEAENAQLMTLRSDVKEALAAFPASVKDMKEELLSSMRKAITDKFAIIMQESSVAISDLLEQISQMRSDLAEKSIEDAKSLITDTENEIKRVINLLEGATTNNASELKNVVNNVNMALGKMTESLNDSVTSHSELVTQLSVLVPLIKSETEKADSAISTGNNVVLMIEDVLKTLDIIVSKNQQLTFELSQWKRVHKKVEIDQEKGTKKCPNCGIENPIDANYCRKCTFSFWEVSQSN